MHISAKADYAVRTLLQLAAADGAAGKAEALASAMGVSHKFLESVLADLRRTELVRSRRGPDGGYWLARPAADISIADVIRAVEGPLASVRGQRPEDVEYSAPAKQLQLVWLAVRVNMREVLEKVSLADIVADDVPAFVLELTADPSAWARRQL
ncbi:MAG: Rrf2 family transcriptional regulator [Rhodococcus sp. (in: high G+C Gram-positive bacteria)]|uniref:RrF2 family transcriptional regulator n=1 Tax=Rhodococcus sp. I2R TaxID=2855445 RepID=UPI00096407D5|nr:Rrf2 family transcriptional regulator [Rhodococcus sp. I2R]MCC8929113.1 Rrf2 family transcriptional regulator [Rhodococcus sp. I2R]OLT35544.1 BadM/Rrf2 family transcriptional regulator [Rhodococcus sp. CUA-806]